MRVTLHRYKYKVYCKTGIFFVTFTEYILTYSIWQKDNTVSILKDSGRPTMCKYAEVILLLKITFLHLV